MKVLLLFSLIVAGCGPGLAPPRGDKAAVNAGRLFPFSFIEVMTSTMHHTPGISLPLASEHTGAATLSGAYRLVPTLADVDFVAASAAHAGGTTFSECGTTGTVRERAEHCATVNASALWAGTVLGNMGESNWRLVSKMSTNVEIWQDLRTGLVWSDYSGKNDSNKKFNWCDASGYAGTGVCMTTFSGSPACNAAATLVERGGLDEAAGVYWRLPTLSDYKLADIDGIKYIFDELGPAAPTYWLSTVFDYISGPVTAWSVNGLHDYFSVDVDETSFVRCVGRVSP